MAAKRTCGDCQLCCRLLPTEEIGKAANVRCQYQKHGVGCAIHSHKPASCSLWNCRWLINDDMDDQQRPDRTGIVHDIMPDVLRIVPNDGTPPKMVPAIVVWIDPDRRDLWRTSAGILRYVARQECPVLVRFSSSEGTVLLPPAVTGDHEIIEHPSSTVGDMPTTLQEKAAALGATLQLPDDNSIYEPAVVTMPDGRQIKLATKWREK